MNWEQDVAGESPELGQALKHFKVSLDTWSEHAMSRPRTAKSAVRHSRRMVAAWALGCLLAVGSMAAAGYEIYQRQEVVRIAAQKAADQRAAAAQGISHPASVQPVSAQTNKKTPAATTRKASSTSDSAEAQDANLLASVDSDVSREVPAAMEPLAQLMDDDGTQ